MMEDSDIKIISDAIAGNSVEYVKLIKNTRGYNWEIKILSLDIDEVEKINNELIQRFGTE